MLPSPLKPLVSVIVPVFNRMQYLEQAIGSALRQTYPAIEVIVVDDGSSVDPAPVVARFPDRVRLVRKPNGGLSSARNFGITAARGEYVLFLDDDDFLELDAMEALWTALHEQPGSVWAAGKFDYVDEAGRPTVRRHECRYSSGDVYERLIFNNLMGAPSVVLVAADALRRVGGFDESLRLSEDWDMWLTLARHYPLVAIEKKIVNYRVHRQQISRTQWARLFEHNLRVLEKHRNNSRDGTHELFDAGIAKVHARFGDELYMAGECRAARAQWRRALSNASWKVRLRFAPRIIKSCLPADVLEVLRHAAQAMRASCRSDRASVPAGLVPVRPHIR